ncbi:MAG TPA: DUF4129 domain-containing protein [Pseudonocardia sp.]|nr:DUF4129 domain-containing protein [Pseudonocardia sp.]
MDIGRDAAREAAERELARPEYAAAQPSLLVRAVTWLLAKLGDLLSRAAELTPSGYGGLLALVVVLVLAAVAVRLVVGRVGRTAARADALFDAAPESAANHRRAADTHAEHGRWARAVRERLRAVVRELAERGLLDERAGRTATEVAAEAGRVLPGCAAQLRAAAQLFDDVWYGGEPATAEMDTRLRDLDEAVRRARPAQPAEPEGKGGSTPLAGAAR